jgi:DNA-directed RNA polymerase specialized sigma24 family protein
MKAWLARAAASTVLRGEHPRDRLARWTRWSRWFPPTPTVEEARFQGADEPRPGHWREFPRAWPALAPAAPEVRDTLAAALDELPRPWREVVLARDVRRRSAAEVGEQLGVTPAQQRAILNRARARLRERLAERFARRDGGGGGDGG